MKRLWEFYLVLGIGIGSLLLASRCEASDAIAVRVDTRVELLAIVFRLAGAEEYDQPSSQSPYAAEVMKHFGAFKEHPVVKLAAKLREEDGIGFDAVMSYAVHLRSDRLAPKIPFDATPPPLDKRWKPEDAARFLVALKQFVTDSKADAFFAAHQPYYRKAAQRLEAELAARPYRSWLDSFFGAKPQAHFAAIVGLLNGGGNYGMAVRYSGGQEEILPIIGADKFDSQGLPVFGPATTSLIVHEFCHSYTNPLVDQFAAKLLPAATTIFPYRKALMAPQAYGTPQTMLYESLVRACTVRFAQDNDTPQMAAAALKSEQARGFLWTDDLAQLLGTYEHQRHQYPTLQAFMPQIVDFFAQTATSIELRMAKLPKIVSLSPTDGNRMVDPATTEIRIEFDRPMQTDSYSIVG
ncbi:MAG: hypothetical protein JWN14_4023, partial [Chthonomonadales bacterium]|nr:hypothetical protein [Chthonomonadales bacterium]